MDENLLMDYLHNSKEQIIIETTLDFMKLNEYHKALIVGYMLGVQGEKERIEKEQI